MEDPKTKMMKETPYELLEYDEKGKLGKNNKANMTLNNALPHKKSTNEFSCVKPPRRFGMHFLLLIKRAKVMAIEEAKYLATLPLNELIGNLKVYKMVLENDGIVSKITKEKVKSLALKAKVTREQTCDDSDFQEGNDECKDKDKDEEFNLLTRNFIKFFRKVALVPWYPAFSLDGSIEEGTMGSGSTEGILALS
ncbi:hypothetical protein Tco_0153952 [Tanacetum coccineum]